MSTLVVPDERRILDSLGSIDPDHDDPQQIFESLQRAQKLGNLHTLVPILPMLLHLNGKPYSLDEHPQFEDLYRTVLPQSLVLMTARQVAKSTNQAASGIMRAVSLAFFRILYVTPLYEQIRRFSSNYVAPFINNSPVRSLFAGTNVRNSVLQRSFHNSSMMIFSYAALNADRIRGVSADFIGVDEAQDMVKDVMAVINEVMSHSSYKLVQYTGTPKTLDNNLTELWQKSSMAEWFVPCQHCTENGFPTWNIPSTEHHLIKMIGTHHLDDIGPAADGGVSGLVCHKCAKPLRPDMGRWVHRYPDLRWVSPGGHIPQPIMPIHYADKAAWAFLLAKMQGGIPTNNLYNEVFGEPFDTAAKLVTMTELQAAADLGPNTIENALKLKGRYKMTVLAADWGGGGEAGISLTTVALLGLKQNGDIEVPFAKRLMTPHDHLLEAKEVMAMFRLFRPSFFAHDYTGAGSLRETFMIQAGMPLRQVMPCMYVRSASQKPCFHVKATQNHPRNHFRVDKSRTLLLTCGMIKQKKLRMFNWDRISSNQPGMISDFLSLIEEKTQTMAAGELYRIDKMDGMIDDFSQAVNIGCTCLWHFGRAYPNLAMPSRMILTQQQAEEIAPLEGFRRPNEVGTPGND